MIYLIFDTNIWLDFILRAGMEEDELDIIETWVENNLISILLPSVIITEWDRNKEEYRKNRITSLKIFFDTAKSILPNDISLTAYTTEVQKQIVQSQIERVEVILKHNRVSVKELPLEQNIKDEVIRRGIEKVYPFDKDKKNNVGDTIIFVSFIEFLKNNQCQSYFVSKNVNDFFENVNKAKNETKIIDFYEKHWLPKKVENDNLEALIFEFAEKKHKLPIDVQQQLDNLQSQTFTTLENAIRKIKKDNHLLIVDSSEKKRFKINKQLESFYTDISNLPDIYLKNTKHLDIILDSDNPTRQEVLFALGLIKEDNVYKTHFLKNVNSPIWFPILEKQGYFNPVNNPDIIWHKENEYSFPFWEILDYLIKLSKTIKQGKNLDLIDKIIAIIEAVSQSDVNNQATFSNFCDILINFPNESVSIELINLTTAWVTENHRNSLLTHSFFKLLYKFLHRGATENDKEKAKVILEFLFKIQNSANFGREYYSQLYMYYFKEEFINIENLSLILSQHQYFVFDLALQIKKILLNFVNPLIFSIFKNEIEFQGLVFVKSENLIVQISKREQAEEGFMLIDTLQELKNDDDISVVSTFSIDNYKEYDEKWVTEELSRNIKKDGFSEPQNETYSSLESIGYLLFNDFSKTEIQDLDNSYNYENLKKTFQYILRELLLVLAKNKPEEAKKVLFELSFGKEFNIPFFRRLSLYVISKEWESMNAILSHFIDETDTKHYFSDYKYEKELYQLLNENQSLFNEKWLSIFDNIIKIGPQDEKEDRHEKYYKHWQFKWIAALRDLEQYKNRYKLLSKELNKTSESVENLGRVRITSGSNPPMTMKELLNKNHNEIIDFINNFNPDRWQDANISGFSELIGNACENEYQYFINDLSSYEKVPYIYAYRMIYGFSKAIKSKKIKQVDFSKILTFCNRYISTTSFINDELKLENDGWSADKDWIIGITADLISDLIRNNNGLSEELVSIKDIIKKLINNLGISKFDEKHEKDYVQYLINSTAGKVLRTLFDYALHFANINYQSKDDVKWEDDVKELFNANLLKNDIEIYILLGNYFEHFSYLDNVWTTETLNNILDLDKEWRAFIGGIEYSSPPNTAAAYELLVPHYYKAIEQKIKIKDGLGGSLARHFVWNYLSGDKYLYEDDLMQKYLEESDRKGITATLQVFLSQSKHVKYILNNDYERKITDIWKFIIKKYENSEIKEEKGVVEYTSNLLCFLIELSSENIEFVLKSCTKTRYLHSIVDDLSTLKSKGDKDITANYLGQILLNFDLEHDFYLSNENETKLTEIVEFLYLNNQKNAADEFCNRMAKKGKTFLNAIFEKYNNSTNK